MKSKERYIRRMEFCKEKRILDRTNGRFWQEAVGVYQHLIECNLSHTLKRDGRSKCQFEFADE
jgi:hypothetical protein